MWFNTEENFNCLSTSLDTLQQKLIGHFTEMRTIRQMHSCSKTYYLPKQDTLFRYCSSFDQCRTASRTCVGCFIERSALYYLSAFFWKGDLYGCIVLRKCT